jgi:uncharacterized protein (DUF342 family)
MIKIDVTDERAELSLSVDDDNSESLSLDAVIEQLREAGVTSGILDSALEGAIQQVMLNGRPVKRVVVARWIEPQAGRAAEITHCVPHDQVAAENDVIAELGEPTAAIDGQSVRGKVLAAPVAVQTLLAGGANTRMVGETLLRAAVYGTVKVSAQEISVESLVRVAADDLSALIDVHPKSSLGTPITPAMLQAALQAAGVVYGVDQKAIAAALEQAVATESTILAVTAAEGQPGVRGEDGRLEQFVATEQAIGEQREDGSIDFRERSSIRNVKAGVHICRRIPPTLGEPRIDVYGNRFDAEYGRDIEHIAGENVERRGDEFWSMMDGAVMIREGVVTVSDIYAVQGDIDLTTGNLHQAKGAVHITGAVRSGFSVRASSHILVDRLVEDATLASGANVEIQGGVLHAGEGSITAAGHVEAKFAQNARIVAGGNIVINGSAIGCDLNAGNRIEICGKKGNLVGGVARAARGIRVRQLGAEAGVATQVEVGIDQLAVDTLQGEIDQIRQQANPSQAQVAELKKLVERLRTLTDIGDSKSIAIEVENAVYSGVSVTLFGAHYRFTDDHGSCRIHLNAERQIELSPL